MGIISSLPKANNLPHYVQYDEDTLIKYVDSDNERFAVVRTSDELLRLHGGWRNEVSSGVSR